MSSEREARICTRERRDGTVEISTYDPQTGREVRTGLTCKNTIAEVDKSVQQIADIFKKSGARVSTKEL
jgi:hypothetical protein